jgi:hypothetical protein
VITTDLAPPSTGTLARISDARAIQYWDPDRAVSTYLISTARANPSWLGSQDRERLTSSDFIVWDVVLAFPAGSYWESALPQPSFYAGPVVDELERMRATLTER